MIEQGMAQAPGSDTPLPHPSRARRGRKTKIARILHLLYQGRSLNRFEAERHHDHCLHSTISALCRLGLTFRRRREDVPCVNGQEGTNVTRYWLAESEANMALARTLLGAWGQLPNVNHDQGIAE